MAAQMNSINPATAAIIQTYTPHSAAEIETRLAQATQQYTRWRQTSFAKRATLIRELAAILLERKSDLAILMANEMGKILKEGESEIEKCASACTYYAQHAEKFLADEIIHTSASRSLISYQPIGPVLAIMPWNFPFWQVFRFAAPNLMAGNVGVLKHASNVSGCGLALEKLFLDAGFPAGCFATLLLPGSEVKNIIADPRIKAITLTGSTPAGKTVAAQAGSLVKKTVLELGGSDPYIVLHDADIEQAAKICAQSRLLNAGQSCIAAKRFIVVPEVIKEFTNAFIEQMRAAKFGDPHDAQNQIGPMARHDLRDALHEQVQKSIQAGAMLALGGTIPEDKGAYYPPTVLTNVAPGMPAFDEELFGPVAAIIAARDENQAFELANMSEFGLGGAIFSSDSQRAEQLAKTQLESGQVFINSLVKSTPELPFGGVKASGYGRELSHHGIFEFVNIKTISIS